jgi:dGTPase
MRLPLWGKWDFGLGIETKKPRYYRGSYSLKSIDKFEYPLMKRIIDRENIIDNSQIKIDQYAPTSMHQVMNLPEQLIVFSPEMKIQADNFRKFMYKNVYFSHAIKNQAEIATAMLRHLFEYFCRHPENMGRKAQSRLAKDGLKRTVCDYLSGFTDKYVFQEHTHYFR